MRSKSQVKADTPSDVEGRREHRYSPRHVIERLLSSQVTRISHCSIMWLITVFTILSAINVHTLAFSWHRNDPSELFTGAEHSVPQDLLYSGLHFFSRKLAICSVFYTDIGLGKDAIDSVDGELFLR